MTEGITPYRFFKQTKRYQRRSQLTMWESFLLYLDKVGGGRFTTSFVFDWYKRNKRGKSHADYSAIYPNILVPLRERGLIKNIELGTWSMVEENARLKLEELESKTIKAQPSSEEELSKEDEEFFRYVESKIKVRE